MKSVSGHHSYVHSTLIDFIIHCETDFREKIAIIIIVPKCTLLMIALNNHTKRKACEFPFTFVSSFYIYYALQNWLIKLYAKAILGALKWML